LIRPRNYTLESSHFLEVLSGAGFSRLQRLFVFYTIEDHSYGKMTEGGEKAWVTLATNDSYALGAVVLANSLKRVNSTGKLVVMITPGVSGAMRGVLESTFDSVTEVNVLDSLDATNLALLTRPELGITFTKLHCWRLIQYEKCVFLDADTLVLQNCDELFNREELSAAPDSGWPDCFNSGVFVFQPSLDKYQQLLKFAVENGSFDGGDQGLLNSYFSDWSTADIGKHLPFTYNMVATATYSYLPAYRVFGHNVKIAHFIGPSKPWMQFYNSATGRVQPEPGQEHLQALLQAWWDIFRSDVHPKLTSEMKGLAGAYAKMSLEGTKSNEQLRHEDAMRKNAWEQGRMDYLGADSFDNIMKKIQASLAQTAVVQKPRAKSPSPAKNRTTPPPESTTPVSQPIIETKQESPAVSETAPAVVPSQAVPAQTTVETKQEPTPATEDQKDAPTPVSEAPKAESTPVVEAPKTETPPVVEAPKAESVPVVEAPKAEPTPVVEAPKAEPTPVAEAPKAETAPVVEAPKAEPTPVAEAPKAETAPVVEAPKAESPPVVEAPKAEASPVVDAR
jgi:glycogenin glucosyltransferase